MNDDVSANLEWASLVPLLACPGCRQPLALTGSALRCAAEDVLYPIRDGIPMLARFGSAEQWGDTKPTETSESYQKSYQDMVDATQYNKMYAERWSKRWTTRREYTLLSRLLSTQPRSTTLLDLPCGGGRLSSQLAPHTDVLIESDIALGQVQYGRKFGLVGAKQCWMVASGFHIPFRDASLDGAVCVRLNHHLPTPEERERLVRELLRVARRFVIMTFFDYHSLKNLGRRLRRPFDGKPPKMTMTVEHVRRLARECGAELIAWPAVLLAGSGHRYALMVKRQT